MSYALAYTTNVQIIDCGKCGAPAGAVEAHGKRCADVASVVRALAAAKEKP